MKFSITVSTQVGTIYVLQQEGDKLYLKKDLIPLGEVIKLYQPIRVDGILHVDFILRGFYSTPKLGTIRSAKITDITIR